MLWTDILTCLRIQQLRVPFWLCETRKIEISHLAVESVSLSSRCCHPAYLPCSRALGCALVHARIIHPAHTRHRSNAKYFSVFFSLVLFYSLYPYAINHCAFNPFVPVPFKILLAQFLLCLCLFLPERVRPHVCCVPLCAFDVTNKSMCQTNCTHIYHVWSVTVFFCCCCVLFYSNPSNGAVMPLPLHTCKMKIIANTG